MVIHRIQCGNVVFSRDGRILSIMLSANELVPLIHEDARHIPYSEQLRVELSRIGKGQESQPSIIALEFEVVISGRDSHRQLIVVTFFTRRASYLTPHVTTGFEPLLSRLPGETGLAYGVVDGQFE